MARFLIRLLVLFLGILIFFTGLFLGLRAYWEEPLEALAQSRVSAVASQLINEAVSEKIADGTLSCEKIICFEKDGAGSVTALKTDMQQVNQLKNKILSDLNHQLLELDQDEIGIPAGSLILPELLGGRGPDIPVKITAIRKSGGEFISTFSDAGINQTLHRLNLRIFVEGTVLVLGKIQTFSASGTVLVAETVIVGQVPHTFS